MNRHTRTVFALLALLGAGAAQAQAARDQINIVGSSTVYPFVTVVAERFGRSTAFKTPKVESTGTGGGLKLFCQGVGVEHPDVANASRRIKRSEYENCLKNGVTDIIEIKLGYDGIVVANSVAAEPYRLTRRHLYLALAKQVPDPAGAEKLVENPYRRWREIDPALPDEPIEVLGPPPTSGTRDSFNELGIEGGCRTFPWLAALEDTDKNRYKRVCRTLREDGLFIEAGENDNLIVQKLVANPHALGVFGFGFLDQNRDKVQPATIDGVDPTFETIASGEYPLSRAMYVYVKKAHIGRVPGLVEFMQALVSKQAMGEDGYLVDRGLIPLTEEEWAQVRKTVEDLVPLRL